MLALLLINARLCQCSGQRQMARRQPAAEVLSERLSQHPDRVVKQAAARRIIVKFGAPRRSLVAVTNPHEDVIGAEVFEAPACSR